MPVAAVGAVAEVEVVEVTKVHREAFRGAVATPNPVVLAHSLAKVAARAVGDKNNQTKSFAMILRVEIASARTASSSTRKL
jgi:hypothetical protein